jgi:hypothetical protein
MNRPDIERDGIGAVAVWQMERGLEGATALTREALSRALTPFQQMVEDLSSASLQMAPRGLVTAYGPYLNGHYASSSRHLFLLATSVGSACSVLTEWVPDVAAARAHVEKWLIELCSDDVRRMVETQSREELWGHKDWRGLVWPNKRRHHLTES